MSTRLPTFDCIFCRFLILNSELFSNFEGTSDFWPFRSDRRLSSDGRLLNNSRLMNADAQKESGGNVVDKRFKLLLVISNGSTRLINR